MCQTFATLNSTVTILTWYEREWHLRLLLFYSTFLYPLTSLIDFFSLLTICLSLPISVLSSSDQISSYSLNLKRLSLSLHLKSNPKIFFLLSLSSGRAMDWVVIGWDSRWVSWVGVFGGLLVEFWVWIVELVVLPIDLDLASIKLCSISPTAVSLSRSLWSHSPPSRCPGLFDLALHHLPHCWISFLSLAVVVVVFFRVVVVGCVWWFWMVVVGCVWLIWVMVGWFWDGVVDLRFGMVPMGLRFVVVPISLVVCVCVCVFFFF